MKVEFDIWGGIVTRPELIRLPNIPIPLHGLAPRVILGSKWWNMTRQAAYESTQFRCIACGVHKSEALYHNWLEAHELYEYNWDKFELVYKDVYPLCHACHNFIHSGRMQALLNQGKLGKKRFDAIIEHGLKVLYDAGLTAYNDYPDWFIDDYEKNHESTWGEWHIVIDGKSYYSKFSSIDDWRSHYR
jgi:hypothetical protein